MAAAGIVAAVMSCMVHMAGCAEITATHVDYLKRWQSWPAGREHVLI